MGGGVSKVASNNPYVVKINNEPITTIRLKPDATLKDARNEIESDKNEDPEFYTKIPSGGHFRFILSNGTHVAPRKESEWNILESLNGGCFDLLSTSKDGIDRSFQEWKEVQSIDQLWRQST